MLTNCLIKEVLLASFRVFSGITCPEIQTTHLSRADNIAFSSGWTHPPFSNTTVQVKDDKTVARHPERSCPMRLREN
jgi:hypothetical protein